MADELNTEDYIISMLGDTTDDSANATPTYESPSLKSLIEDIATLKTQITALSDNNFTDDLKAVYDTATTEAHTHSNKSLLDGIVHNGDGTQYLANDGTYKTVTGGNGETKSTIETKLGVSSINVTALSNLTGTNSGDETATMIKSKLGITTLSGINTGDQDLSGLATKDLNNITSVGKNVITTNVMPKYANGISKSWGTSLTAECDGWLLALTDTYTGGQTVLTIDGQSVSVKALNTDSWGTTNLVPIAKNSVYSASGTNLKYTGSLTFYPAKGAS